MTIRRGSRSAEPSVTLPGLRAFVATAEALSFSAAAQALGVSQPTVSIQVAALEQACGVLLFQRKPQLVLTGPGQDLFVIARLILSRVDEFDASVRDLRVMQRGRLSIGLSTPHVAMPLIAGFAARFPSIQITTIIGNTSTLLEDVGRCRIDIGIMTLLDPPQNLACQLISAPRLAICVRRDDPLGDFASVEPKTLADRAFVLRERGSMTRQVLEAGFEMAGIALRAGLELGSREAMKEAVAAGLGIGALFEGELGDDARLLAIPFDHLPHRTGVYAVAVKESLDIPAVGAFLDHVAGRDP